MASEHRRRVLLAAAILTVIVALGWWQRTRHVAMPAVVAGQARPAAGSNVAPILPGAVPEAVPVLALGALRQTGAEPADSGRDPFRFDVARGDGAGGGGRRPPPEPPPAPVMPEGPIEPAGPPPPPPILLKYIGRAKQGAGGRILAVLRDDRGVYYGAEGDVIEGRYRLLRVTNDSVDVVYVDGRGRKTIPLSGGQP